MFNAMQFVGDHFGGVDGVVGLVAKHYGEAPQREAVRKWFTRGQIPSEWMPAVLFAAECEMGGQIDLAPYLHAEKRKTEAISDDVFQ